MKKLGLKSYFKKDNKNNRSPIGATRPSGMTEGSKATRPSGMTGRMSFRVKQNKTKKPIRKDYNKQSTNTFSLSSRPKWRDLKEKVFNNKNNKKYLIPSIISLILILSLIPILSNIKQSSKSNAEQVGSSPNNSSTSTIKSLYDNLVTLNHGTSTNYWQRIQTAAEWLPNNDNNPTNLAQASDVCQGKLFYAGDRTIKTGTKVCAIDLGENTRGGDIYITGTGFTTNSIGQVNNTNCQATKFISSTKLRCTIPHIASSHNQTYNVTVTNDGTVDLQTVTYNNNSQGNMQDFTSTECNNLQRGQAIVLTDTRISKGETQPRTYRVKKMADDKCWMIDNLRYADNSWTEPVTNQYMTNDGTSTQSSTNSDVYRHKDPGSSTSGCSPGAEANCYGYLYNWYTATGGTGLYSVSTSGQDVTGNICPNDSNSTNTNPASNKWQLPTGGYNGTSPYLLATDYAILNDAMRDDTGTNIPPTQGRAYNSYDQIDYENWQPTNTFQGIFSGNYYSLLYYQGSSGNYWSSTAHSSTNAYDLYFNSSYVSPGSGGNVKYGGFAVRCVVR